MKKNISEIYESKFFLDITFRQIQQPKFLYQKIGLNWAIFEIHFQSNEPSLKLKYLFPQAMMKNKQFWMECAKLKRTPAFAIDSTTERPITCTSTAKTVAHWRAVSPGWGCARIRLEMTFVQ